MIQVQLASHSLYDGGDDETETIYDRILVYPVQKIIRILIFWCQCNKEYGRVKVDADLERWSANRQCVDCEARRTRADPDPCDVRVGVNWIDAFIDHGLMVLRGCLDPSEMDLQWGGELSHSEAREMWKATILGRPHIISQSGVPECSHHTASNFTPRGIRESSTARRGGAMFPKMDT